MRNCLEKGSGAELKAKDKRFVTIVINYCHYQFSSFCVSKTESRKFAFLFEKLNYEYVLQKG